MECQDNSIYRIPCDSVVYELKFYNIKNDTAKYSNSMLIPAFVSYLNTFFDPTCIRFKICAIDSIRDYNYYVIGDEDKTIEDTDIIDLFHTSYAINIYMVDGKNDATPNGICKTRSQRPKIYFPYQTAGGPDLRSFAKQMLVFFGLNNTSSSMSSRELVNTSNGTTSADSIWDTPADPYDLIGALPNTSKANLLLPLSPKYPKEIYYYNTIQDNNGEYYTPMIYNFMSDYMSIEKRCELLTQGQFQYIVKNERRCRKIRWE
jgi:hypothetical protein